jgi:hypothetical protein
VEDSAPRGVVKRSGCFGRCWVSRRNKADQVPAVDGARREKKRSPTLFGSWATPIAAVVSPMRDFPHVILIINHHRCFPALPQYQS